MGEIEQRLSAVRSELAARSIDVLIVGQADNRRYLTGFTGSSGMAVVTVDGGLLLTDSRYYEQVGRQSPAFTLVRVVNRMVDSLSELLSSIGVERAGFEADTITVSELERFRDATPDVEWVATSGLIERQRAVKTATEIERIGRAVALTDMAMEHAYATARPGISERELAWELEVFMRDHGAEGLAFETIVAAGENSALPHHFPSDRLIEAGEPIVVDMGARTEGYCGDLTRTFSIGPVADPEFATVYGVVDAANRAATDAVRSGITGADADAIARDIIASAGYGDYFGHGLGHGVGLNIHELPRLSHTANNGRLVAGMVVTIEPGIYLPGRFGVRIEDMVVVGDEGVDVLTGVVKQPTIVPA